MHQNAVSRVSRSRGTVFGLVIGTAIFAAVPVLAATPSGGTLPTVNISTTIPAGNVAAADPVSVPALADGMATTAPADAPKPVRHVSRLQLQTIDTANLTVTSNDGRGRPLHNTVPLVIEARATALRPAPLPDQDMDAPGPDAQTLASQQEASVGPSFYGNKDHFSGDGFSAGSNLESDKNNRRRPGGGMSLSIPVQ